MKKQVFYFHSLSSPWAYLGWPTFRALIEKHDLDVVVRPTRKGFGSQVIERGLAHELRGKVRLDYLPEGLVCTIDLPVRRKVACAAAGRIG